VAAGRIEMRKPEPNFDSVTSDERFSRREQCGVEIFEHDVITRVRTSNENVVVPSSPLLVVTDAVDATRNFVSKRRSEFRELDAFLKSVAPTQSIT
jgi:hypothetical protein